MNKAKKLAVACALALMCLCGCTVQYPPEYFVPPPPKTLRALEDEMAVVYLLRAPHDSAVLTLHIDNGLSFKLPPESYVALTLKPGTYQLTGTQTSMWGSDKPAFPPTSFQVEAGQRAFLYTSSETSAGIPAMAIFRGVGGVLIPLFDGTASNSAVSGTRIWKECTELDAQGFMSIAKEITLDGSGNMAR